MTKSLTPNKQLSQPVPGRVPAGVGRDLMAMIAEYGGDTDIFLRDAGLLSLKAVLLDRSDERDSIAHRDFTRLYARATALLDEVAGRQEGRSSITKGGIDMMCYAIITCRTLHDVIARMDSFFALMAPRTGRLTLTVARGEARLDMATIRKVRNSCAYLSDLTGLATHHRLFGWLIGEDIPLSGAAMRYPPLLDARTVAYLLPYPVEHHAPENSLRFPARYLDRPVVRDHHELDLLLERFPFDIEEPQSKQTPLSDRISHLYASMLASGDAPVTGNELARQFSISVATLKRRLTAEGTSLSQIKANSRRELAAHLLRDPRLSIAEVARRAHFSDTGSFCRAFRQWTGKSPSRWRGATEGGAVP